jgi:hypothetical protein
MKDDLRGIKFDLLFCYLLFYEGVQTELFKNSYAITFLHTRSVIKDMSIEKQGMVKEKVMWGIKKINSQIYQRMLLMNF